MLISKHAQPDRLRSAAFLREDPVHAPWPRVYTPVSLMQVREDPRTCPRSAYGGHLCTHVLRTFTLMQDPGVCTCPPLEQVHSRPRPTCLCTPTRKDLAAPSTHTLNHHVQRRCPTRSLPCPLHICACLYRAPCAVSSLLVPSASRHK